MRFFLAIIGSTLIFVSVLIISTLLTPILCEQLTQTFHLGPIYTNNVSGVLLALVCAAAAFRDSLMRRKTPPDQAQ